VPLSTAQNNMTTIVDTVYKRAAWIGDHRLWPRHTLVNASDWTPTQNREYQEAFDVQECVIKQGMELETLEQYDARVFSCGAVAPDAAVDVLDKYLAIAELEADIRFQQGLIQGFKMCREHPESMMQVAEKEVLALKVLHKERIEAYWNEYPQHLIRHGKHVFVKGMPQDDETEQDQLSCKNPNKRSLDTAFPERIIHAETTEYWLKHGNLTWGILCIKRDEKTFMFL